MFGFCRFSQITGENQRLYVTAMHGDIYGLSSSYPLTILLLLASSFDTNFSGDYVRIISWDVNSWKRSGSKRIGRDPISAFNVSLDGKFLAM